MLSFRIMIATTLGLSFLAATGLSDADTGSGPNGLKPSNFSDRQIQAELWNALKHPLAGPGVGNVYPVHASLQGTNLLNTPGGRDVFDHAVRCGVGLGKSITYAGQPTSGPVKGRGYLRDTSSWLTQPLLPAVATAQSTVVAAEFFECLAIHLNGVNTGVPFAFVGDKIAREDNVSKYTIPEAIWTMNSKGVLQVYPHPKLEAACGRKTSTQQSCSEEDIDSLLSFQEAFNKRVCGTIDPAHCGVKRMPRKEFLKECRETSSGHWSCFQKPVIPAIETRLDPETAINWYPECDIKVWKLSTP